MVISVYDGEAGAIRSLEVPDMSEEKNEAKPGKKQTKKGVASKTKKGAPKDESIKATADKLLGKKPKKEKPPKPERVCITKRADIDWDKALPLMKKWDAAKEKGTITDEQWPGLKAMESACVSKVKTPRSHWCAPCTRIKRKAQLAFNNITWMKRAEQGKAGHHKQYRGKPTKVVKQLKAAGYVDPDKYVTQGEPPPESVIKKIAQVHVPASKPKGQKVKHAPLTKQQKDVAKRTREARKREAEKGKRPAEAPKRPAPPLPPKGFSDKQMKEINAAFSDMLKVSGLHPEKTKPKRKVKTEKKQNELELVPTTREKIDAVLQDVKKLDQDAAKLTRLPLTGPDELYADAAKMGQVYLISGREVSLFSKKASGDIMFEYVDGNGAPFSMTPDSIIRKK